MNRGFELATNIISLLRGVFLKVFYFKNLKSSGRLLVSNFSSIKIHRNSNINLSSNTILNSDTLIESFCEINIGCNFYLNKYSRIISKSNISIGDNVTIAQFVSILDHDHRYELFMDKNIKFDGYNVASIKIGNNVWIGDKVTICKGVEIGDNVIIGANSVVTSDIKSNAIYAGVPAKFIKDII
jgi:acetyltransferase-like isoleucine patch superfamily enzyme